MSARRIPVLNVDKVLSELDFEPRCEGAQCTSDDPKVRALVSAKACLRGVCSRGIESLLLCAECTEHYTKRGGVCGHCHQRMPARLFKVVRWL